MLTWANAFFFSKRISVTFIFRSWIQRVRNSVGLLKLGGEVELMKVNGSFVGASDIWKISWVWRRSSGLSKPCRRVGSYYWSYLGSRRYLLTLHTHPISPLLLSSVKDPPLKSRNGLSRSSQSVSRIPHVKGLSKYIYFLHFWTFKDPNILRDSLRESWITQYFLIIFVQRTFLYYIPLLKEVSRKTSFL